MRWSSWLPGPTKKLRVKVKPLKLEGISFHGESMIEVDEKGKERMIVLKMEWKGSKSGLAPFYRVSTCQSNYSNQKLLREDGLIEWDDDDDEEEEFESICSFWIGQKDKTFSPWEVSFNVLYGTKDTKCKTKLTVLGNVSSNIAELASTLNSQVERKIPISLQLDGAIKQPTLLIGVSFAEVGNSNDSLRRVRNSVKSDNTQGSFGMVDGQTTPKKREKEEDDRPSSCDSDGLPGNESMATSEDSNMDTSSGTELASPMSSETQSNLGSNVRFFSWTKAKRRLSFGLSKSKRESLIKKKVRSARKDETRITTAGNWEVKELASRDGQAKLNTNVFLASIDQRSEKAAGESACTAIVAVIADWLQSNPTLMPTLSQFDSLITEGSSQWRQLCENGAYVNSFPDNHFDLETVLHADLRPLTILPQKSFTGIFSPEKFENLKGAMSFNDIWKEISSKTTDYDQEIFIVSWNDHFFVLKVDAEAYYIIDSLGERLFEGCNQAYILKFDDSSSIYGKVAKEEAESDQDKEESEDKIICRGKECCGEFIKRFLAAIPVGELEEEEKKGTVSTFSLLQRLQIDFHYCSSSPSFSSPSSSPASSTSSIFLCKE